MKSVVRLTDRPDMTLDVYRGRKTTMQQQQQQYLDFKAEYSNPFNPLMPIALHKGHLRHCIQD